MTTALGNNQGVEVNFDGLIGPTHNYGGLSHGNVASKTNALKIAYPKLAALQGLQKMQFMRGLGLEQGILLPQQRPHLPTLRALGFNGSDEQIIKQVSNAAPELLAQCYSASSMWSANAATVCPSADASDSKVHFTAANLSSMCHRSIEHSSTSRLLKKVFDGEHFSHHDALPSGAHFADEGAANHNRFTAAYDQAGLQLFVYGRYSFRANPQRSQRFPSRQSFEASQSIARLHKLDLGAHVFAQQNPEIIDAGAFHNDVVSVSNLSTFFTHEQAFVDQAELKTELQTKFRAIRPDTELDIIEVPTSAVSLSDAVSSYLFNSQLVQLPGQEKMTLVLPTESRDNRSVAAYLNELADTSRSIGNIEFVDVRQSMQNGGGPACLRLRVALNEEELAAVNPQFMLTNSRLKELNAWVERHYRDQLIAEDLADPQLARECFTALDELTQLFELGSFYEFQR